MAAVQLILILLLASAFLRALAQRVNVPHPVMLVFGGLALAVMPGMPHVELDPDVLFTLFIPPLLYWGALTSSLRDLKTEWGPIARLSIGLVLATIATVAIAAHMLTPEFTWAAAFVLGAVVSPPDPVAPIAVMRPLGVPPAITSILEAEGLLNDATALVGFRMAVTAAVAGVFVPHTALPRFLYAAIVGIIVGLVIGRIVVEVRNAIAKRVGHMPIVENALSLLVPFAAYLSADHIGASGVIAVVTVGLYAGRKISRNLPAVTRIQAEAMWSMVTFVLESLTFILIGLQLNAIRATLGAYSTGMLLGYAAIISAVVIFTRLFLIYPSAYIPRWIEAWRCRRKGLPPIVHERDFRDITFIGWTGLRGGGSLIIALAIPFETAKGAPFPARDLIIFLTFSVIFATLVLQGLTLAPAIRWLGLQRPGPARAEEDRARLQAARAALERLDKIERIGSVPEDILVALRGETERKARHWDTHVRLGRANGRTPEPAHLVSADDDSHDWSETYRNVRCDMIDAEREAVIELRDSGAIGDDVLRRVQRELDFETMVLSSLDVSGGTPYDVPTVGGNKGKLRSTRPKTPGGGGSAPPG